MFDLVATFNIFVLQYYDVTKRRSKTVVSGNIICIILVSLTLYTVCQCDLVLFFLNDFFFGLRQTMFEFVQHQI